MESEERLLCLLHFRTDIARCRWTVSVSLSARRKKKRLLALEKVKSTLCLSNTFLSLIVCPRFKKKKTEKVL